MYTVLMETVILSGHFAGEKRLPALRFEPTTVPT